MPSRLGNSFRGQNAATWTNLGLLFFHHNDHDLANEALYRAQSADPDYTLAWLGQALVAINQGHDTGATGILAHAVGLNNSVVSWQTFATIRAFFTHVV